MAVVPTSFAGVAPLLAQGLPALSAVRSIADVARSSSNPLTRQQAPWMPPTAMLRRFTAQPDPLPSEAKPNPAASSESSASYQQGFVAPHAGIKKDVFPESFMHHPIYTPEYVESVAPKHVTPAGVRQHIALLAIQLTRWTFDKATGYGPNMTEAKWLRRIIFLETVAGVPGMVAGMLRHLKSLRSMQRDNGWIHTLLEEAENERMHLLIFFQLRQPGPLFRAMVILAQGVFFNFYFLAYLLSPRTCHAFVGFLEEEAVKTYTHALKDIDAGKLWQGRTAPQIAIDYWRLPADATMRDMILAVRADEACHSHVNHTFSQMAQADTNPFAQSTSQLP